MSKIFLTSDLHFGHDRAFIWGPRGFESAAAHDSMIVENWNNTVTEEDEVYVLGDLMLGDNEYGINLLKLLKGKIHIIIGNHDTEARIELYKTLPNVISIAYADRIKYKKLSFYLSHYPTLTCNLDEAHFSQHTFNLFGHTHSKNPFFNDNPFMYNVAVDANNCTPVLLDTIIEKCREKYDECGAFL